MKVALFVPCYVDQFYPRVARATLELLEKQGLKVEFPLAQTCCGQPLANAGGEDYALAVYRHFVETFAGYEYIVSPSGSCVYHVRHHFARAEQTPEVQHVRARTYELCQFLSEVIGVEGFDFAFPHRVGLHIGCHAQRGLRLAQSSELSDEWGGVASSLLKRIKGLELVELDRRDECCGFGGTFCVTEEAVSVRMGLDRVLDHQRHEVEVLTGSDMSCLMHLEGIIRRHRIPIKVMHIAEILNGGHHDRSP
jgi:L-lactate dehydrogenase complex protein LldE